MMAWDGELLARSYMAMGRHADAVPNYEKAVKLIPGDAQLLVDYADALGCSMVASWMESLNLDSAGTEDRSSQCEGTDVGRDRRVQPK